MPELLHSQTFAWWAGRCLAPGRSRERGGGQVRFPPRRPSNTTWLILRTMRMISMRRIIVKDNEDEDNEDEDDER